MMYKMYQKIRASCVVQYMYIFVDIELQRGTHLPQDTKSIRSRRRLTVA